MKTNLIKSVFMLALFLFYSVLLSAETIDGLNYRLNTDSQTAEISDNTRVAGAITIPDQIVFQSVTYKVTGIAEYAFLGNKSLTWVTIGKNVTTIGPSAFSGCTRLGSIVVPDNVTSLGGGVFENCTSLATAVLGNGITSINGFKNCTSLTSATFSDQVTSIGGSAFHKCEKLVSVTIPGKLKSVGEEAFRECKSLLSVDLPKGVTSIGTNAFFDCISLKAINVAGDNPNYSSKDGILYDKEQANILFVPRGITGEIIVPGALKMIDPNTFRDCKAMNSVIIQSGITAIGLYAFSGCTELTKVTMSDDVTQIANYAFYGCSSLASVALSKNLTQLGYYVFQDCKKLQSITIPDGISEIQERTFADCGELTEINFGKNLTVIWNKAFSGCSSLTAVTIPASVTTIGDEAFAECISLNAFILGEKVDSIGIKIFSNCKGLKEIRTLNPIPPRCGTDCFYMTVPNLSNLYVAHGAVDAYKNAEVWKTFKKITELYEDGKKPFTASVSPSANGIVLINGETVDGKTNVKEGTDVLLTFKPGKGYKVSSATLNQEDIKDQITDGTYTVKSVNANLAVSAEFEPVVYKISVLCNTEQGSVAIDGENVSSKEVGADSQVTFTLTPKEGYYPDKILVNNEEKTMENNTYTINPVVGDVAFEVRFKKYLNVSAEYNAEQGSVKMNGQEVTSLALREGARIDFVIQGKGNYVVEKVMVNERDITDALTGDGSYSMEMSGDVNVKALFADGSSIAVNHAGGWTAYATDGKIVIEHLADGQQVLIIGAGGQTVYRGTAMEIRLDAGFYFVKVTGMVKKLIVR